jgi:transposase
MAGRPSLLTPQLVEGVALLTAEGLSAAKIAQAVGVSRRTVLRARAVARDCGLMGPAKATVAAPSPAAEVPDLHEVLLLLGQRARDGNVRAQELLLKHHAAQRAEPKPVLDPFTEVDELARRRSS